MNNEVDRRFARMVRDGTLITPEMREEEKETLRLIESFRKANPLWEDFRKLEDFGALRPGVDIWGVAQR